MTGQEKHTRLTLDEMIRRSEQVKEAKSKNKTKELYVESLDGTITITKPTRSYTVSFNANNTGITIPSAITKSYSYSGHYTAATNGTQMINENGYITSSFKNTSYTEYGCVFRRIGCISGV